VQVLRGRDERPDLREIEIHASSVLRQPLVVKQAGALLDRPGEPRLSEGRREGRTPRESPRSRRGGAAYHNRNVGIFTVRDGKIAAVREYTDTQHAAHVLFGTP
jgi:hypothetical protein